MRICDWSSDVCSSDLTVRAQREVWRDPARQFYFGPVELRGRPIHGPNYTSIHALKLDVLEIVVEGRRVEYQLSVEQFRFQTALIRAIGRASCRERVCQYV